jgi:hypothetical protein
MNTATRPPGSALGGTVGAQRNADACLSLALAGCCVQAVLIVALRLRDVAQLPTPN